MSNDERPESLAAQAASWVPPWERQQQPPDRAFQAEAEQTARAEAEQAARAEAEQAARAEAESVARAEAEPIARAEAERKEPRPDDDEERSEAGLSDDDDDFDASFEGANPPGYLTPDSDDTDKSEMSDGVATATAAMTADDEGVAPEADKSPAAEAEPALEAEVAPEADESPAAEAVPEEPAAGGVDSPAAEAEPAGAPTAAEVEPDVEIPAAVADAEADAEDDGGVPADAPLPPDGDDAGDVFDAAADDDVSDDDDVDIPFSDEPKPAVPEQGGRKRHLTDDSVDARPRTSSGVEVSELPDLIEDADFAAALEAILLVVDEPVAEMQLAQILEQPTERVAVVLEDISARYTAAGHGFDLRRAAGGWRLYTRPEYAPYVERFVLDGQSVRLTQAALETLAVVAYKQPVTRSRISAIRGVNCDGVMRTLATRGLIEECGTEGETGAYLYRTTPLFLEKLGLNSVDQLPPLAPFLPDDVEEVLDASG